MRTELFFHAWILNCKDQSNHWQFRNHKVGNLTLLNAIYFFILLTVFILSSANFAHAAQVRKTSTITMFGTPKYASNFTHLEYANPNAPKGGTLKLAEIGGFDSLNPYILKGQAPKGVALLYEPLFLSPLDEAFSSYAYIAKNISIQKDRVVFELRKEAKWHDGKPITADDVVWTFLTLKKKGHPFYRSYYADVEGVGKGERNTVVFMFSRKSNRELPFIIAQMPVLPKHYWTAKGRDFSSTTMEPPLGSGPYKIASVDAGKSVTLERVQNWWAKNMPINRGRYNFDAIHYDFYRDATVALEAFFAGRYDFREENIARDWAVAYNVPPVTDGRIIRKEVKHSVPVGMQAFVMNTRREIFKDPRVREAMSYAFDFEWANKNIAYGSYVRTDSYFENSELAATGLPRGREFMLLEKFRGQIPDEVFTTVYKLPVSDGSGQDRRLLNKAKLLLENAGWEMKNGKLLKRETGEEFRFEIITENSAFERWTQPFLRNLERLGIKANLHIIDPAQYQARMNNFDFDMTMHIFPESMSPGNEQASYWGSKEADVPGGRNVTGIKSKAVDYLVDKVITATDYRTLLAATHALDRVLLWNHLVIPQWYKDKFHLAYWNKLRHPKVFPKYGLAVVDTWWFQKSENRILKSE